MAEIIVTAYVQEWKFESNEPNPDWGMKARELHFKKYGEELKIIGGTDFTVKAGWEVNIDFRQFKKGDKVRIVGKQVTEEREYQGKKYKTLTIKAQTVEIVQTGNSQAVSQARFAGEEPF